MGPGFRRDDGNFVIPAQAGIQQQNHGSWLPPGRRQHRHSGV